MPSSAISAPLVQAPRSNDPLATPAGGAPPDISVVIATCNRPRTLADAVRSALMQDGVSVEVIIVDDSPDRTAAKTIEALADDRLRYLTNPVPSRGRPAIARNIGIAMARGPLLHVLDDDDIVPDGHYAAAAEAFARQPDIGAVFGRVEPFAEPVGEPGSEAGEQPGGPDTAEIAEERRYFRQARRRALRCACLGHRWAFTAAMLFGPTLLVCSAGMVRRQVAEAIGGFDPALPLCEDVDFYMRAIRHGGARFLDRPALRYRIGPSLMRQPNRNEKLLESARLMHTRYRREHGGLEFAALKALARGIGVS
jgi:glycosyltransferase involved in cell wall biosynthesis